VIDKDSPLAVCNENPLQLIEPLAAKLMGPEIFVELDKNVTLHAPDATMS
jgi:hypothetical protein